MSEKKINLLFVITKLELGGAQKHLLTLARGLDPRRFRIFLFTAREGFLVDEAAAIPGLTLVRSPFLERRIHVVKDIFAFISLYFFIRKNNIGLVHTHSSKAGVLGRLAAGAAGTARIVHTVHGWSFHEGQSPVLHWLFLVLERFCARLTHQLIVVSDYDKKRGLGHRIFPREAYTVIGCGIKTANFGKESLRAAARQALHVDSLDRMVGMVACFKPQKAPLDFVRLAAELKRDIPEMKFLMVGDGVLRPAVVAKIRQTGLEKDVILTGWRQDIAFLLSALDVFVLTSRWEGLPLAVLEAMAAGVPVVATDTGGIREAVLSGENGYLVKPGDIPGMRDKVLTLFQEPQVRERIVQKAAETVKQPGFSELEAIRKIERLYGNAGIVNG